MSTGFLSKVRSNVADKLRTRFSSSEYVIRYNQFVTDDNWGPSAPDMDEIAKMYPEGYYDLLPEMQLRLDNRDTNWRRCYKTLLVIDHLARVLSHNYLEDLRAFVPTLREIHANYKYTDSAGTDRGVSVRERAKKVADLLNDDALLMDEREKTEKTRRAMRGVGCVDGIANAGVHSGGDTKYSGFGAGAGSGAAAAPASGLSAQSSDTSANDRRAQQEAADRRIAQALQDEEDARARVEARRRARGEGSPTTATPPARDVTAAVDDGFGELQAVETSAAASHSNTAAHADDDFGAFVDSRPTQSTGGAGTTDLDAMFAAPAPASQPKAVAAQPASIDDIFGAPAPAAAAPVAAAQPPRGNELDIFAGPSHSGTTPLNQQGSAAPPRQPVW